MDNKVFLFPLSNSVLFRKVTLPFHIFEARYRKMIRDSIDNDIPIAVVTFDPSNNYQGVICVAGMPHILTTYPDGRIDIYITGSVKCRLTDFDEENPYKVYYYKELEEDLFWDDSFVMELDSLRVMLERWAHHFLPDAAQRESFYQTLDEPELLVNYCAVFLVDDFRIKQEIMEADSLKGKVQILLRAIGPREIALGPFMPTLKF